MGMTWRGKEGRVRNREGRERKVLVPRERV